MITGLPSMFEEKNIYYSDGVADNENISTFKDKHMKIDIFNNIDKAFDQMTASGLPVIPEYNNKNTHRDINRYDVFNLIFECIHIYCDMMIDYHFNLYKQMVEIESKSETLSDSEFSWEIRCIIFNDKYDDLFSTIRILRRKNEPPSSYKAQVAEIFKKNKLWK